MNSPSSPKEADKDEIGRRFEEQLATAFALRSSTKAQREDKLIRLRDSLFARRNELYEAFAIDFQKPALEVELTELLPVIDEIRHALKSLSKWMRPIRAQSNITTLGTSAYIAYQPKGRCLIIGPWNYPVNTVLGPLVSAVAAGNTVIVKPSELTPSVNKVIANIIEDVFIPQEVTVIEGGSLTAQTLLDLPFDHIFFTGSPSIGKIVMAAASRHLTSVTLELGGKSPTIVDETADLTRAAEVIMWGKLLNAGQTCVAPDYVLVHHSVHDEFVSCCKKIIQERFGSTNEQLRSSASLSRMININHTARVGKLITDAVDAGASIFYGGTYNEAECYVAPTLLGKIPASAKITNEEIFGPVLPIFSYELINEVIDKINSAPKPLALYIWSRNKNVIRRVLEKTSSGGACINHCVQQYAHSGLPFGGVNHSGIGNAHGYYGFKAFSHERSVLRGSWLLLVRAFFPPYTPAKLQLTKMLVNILRRI